MNEDENNHDIKAYEVAEGGINMGLLKYLMQDFDSNNLFWYYFCSNGSQATIIMRWSQWLHNHGMTALALLAKNKNVRRNGCDIHPQAVIGRGVLIGHPVGIVISGKAEIGENVIIQSGVVLGTKNHDAWDSNVKVGNNCYLGAGAKLMGNITIGDNTVIGANAVVFHDVPADSTAVGIPAKILPRKKEQ